ncbi:OmpA family protein [Rubrolithibacter danxiaensis]|uniref:OmpA family protein n=1 Tax=Rubrolithibacter danxiaensis TaxID=3390805 RepID=UPI003BF7BCA1
MKTNYLKYAFAAGLLIPASVMAQDTAGVSNTAVEVSTTNVQPFSPASSFRTWSVGVHAGILSPIVFFGKNDFTKWKTDVGYGLFVKKQILPGFGIAADFLRGGFKGDNSKALGSGQPNTSPFNSFETDMNWSASLVGELTIANINWLNKKSLVQPFVKAGAGLMGYSTQLERTTGESVEFTPGKDLTEVFFPVGAGLKFNVSPSASLNLGYTMNFLDADNLDGYNNGPQNDKFSYANIGLEFSLGPKSKPQLATYNPVASMQYDYMKQNQALRDELAGERAKGAQQLEQFRQDFAKVLADEDKDGVSDYFDKCPGTSAGTQVDGGGCPLPEAKNITRTTVITEEDKRVVRDAIKNLEFDFGKATIRSKSYPTLDRVANLLVQKNFSLKLSGHTDNVGSSEANLRLSKARAESVKEYLVSKGANPSRIEATGYGESQPISSNKTAAGRQNNRRVEFTLY